MLLEKVQAGRWSARKSVLSGARAVREAASQVAAGAVATRAGSSPLLGQGGAGKDAATLLAGAL